MKNNKKKQPQKPPLNRQHKMPEKKKVNLLKSLQKFEEKNLNNSTKVHFIVQIGYNQKKLKTKESRN